MTEEDIIRMNMLMHGHDTDVKLLELSDKLVDLAVMLAINEDYEKTDFKAVTLEPKLVLRNSKVFLRERFVLHKVPYADETILKLKLHGKLVKDERGLLSLYNKVGEYKDPFDLPVNYVKEPYYFGNVSLLINLSDSDEFLRDMKIYFKSIDLGEKICEMTGVCYVHEIIHTQVESLKGIVREFYNSEVLSIFMELLYAQSRGSEVFKETLKNRINMFLTEFHSLYNYLTDNDCVVEDGKWHNIISCKYIVSTVKAFKMYDLYVRENEFGKSNILWLIQKVFSGIKSLEDILEELGITYENSLEAEHVANLIYRKNT